MLLGGKVIFTAKDQIVWLGVPDHTPAWRFYFSKRSVEDALRVIEEGWGDLERYNLIVIERWTVSYWSLILPLTLLSAYLILWKPRKRVS